MTMGVGSSDTPKGSVFFQTKRYCFASWSVQDFHPVSRQMRTDEFSSQSCSFSGQLTFLPSEPRFFHISNAGKIPAVTCVKRLGDAAGCSDRCGYLQMEVGCCMRAGGV